MFFYVVYCLKNIVIIIQWREKGTLWMKKIVEFKVLDSNRWYLSFFQTILVLIFHKIVIILSGTCKLWTKNGVLKIKEQKYGSLVGVYWYEVPKTMGIMVKNSEILLQLKSQRSLSDLFINKQSGNYQ